MAPELDDARLLVARGRAPEALEAVQSLLRRDPDDVAALLLQGSLLLEAREGDAALASYRRAVCLAPESAEAWNGLARCLHALAQDGEALAAAERARELLPIGENFRQTAPVYLTLVWCLRELRLYREALAAAEAGLERCPDAILAQWAGVVEEELAAAEKEEC